LNNDAGVDELVALKGGLIAWCGTGALEMNMASVAADTGVNLLVAEIEIEAELIAVKG
jgi:hypothetical protein